MNSEMKMSANKQEQSGNTKFKLVKESTEPSPARADDEILDILINQIEFVKRLSTARNTEDFKQRILAVLEPFGFTGFAVITLKSNGRACFSLSSLSEDLTKTYLEQGFYRSDLTLDYLREDHADPIFLSMIARILDNSPFPTRTFTKNRELLEHFQQFAINDAFLIPVRFEIENEAPERSMVWITAEGVNCEDFMTMANRSKPVLTLLATAINYIGQTKFYPADPLPPVKAKALRLLDTMAKNDLTLRETAAKLCVGIDSANKYMWAMKHALGTRSQANAVYLAIKQGLIEL